MNRAEAISEYLLTGKAIAGRLEGLASLRLGIFQEYPYLYRGRREDELAYLAGYAEKPGACVILAEEDGAVIGAATGMPLLHEDAALRAPFAETSYSLDAIYYIGELLFRSGYRNRGLGQRLLTRMENHIQRLGSFSKITCATVERPDDYPLRPGDDLPISRFLARTGFARLAGVTTHFAWLETDGVKRDHTMQFWMKELPGAESELPPATENG
jgi:GNAT superfamily N-acetyltransferase